MSRLYKAPGGHLWPWFRKQRRTKPGGISIRRFRPRPRKNRT